MIDDLDRRFLSVRAGLSSLPIPPPMEVTAAYLAAERSRRRSNTVRSVATASTATMVVFLGLAAVAAPHLDSFRVATSLFHALSGLTNHPIATARLVPVIAPIDDVRTRNLWRTLNAVSHLDKAWTTANGVVLRGATDSGARFYLIATSTAAPVARVGILLPDDVPASGLSFRSFTGRTASYVFFYDSSVAPDQQARIVAAAVKAIP